MPKTIDLSPKLSGLRSAASELQLDPTAEVMGSRVGGLSTFQNAFKRGYGDNVFGADENGMWLGAADYADAPFRVDMSGNLFTESSNGAVVIDTENNRIVIYDADGVPRVLIGYQESGF